MENDKLPIKTPNAVFVIRVWCDEMTGQIRATAKNARDGTQRHFVNLPLLVEFLTQSKEPVVAS